MKLRRNRSLYIAFLLTILTVVCALAGCSSPRENESLSMTGIYFDTVVQVEVWGAERSVLEGCEDLCEYYEQLLSPTIATSEVSKINQAHGDPVSVSGETADLIRLAVKYCDLSEGKFDITVASATDLWEFHDNKEGKMPDAEALAEAVSHIDYRCVQVDGDTVTLTDPQAKIDLGGIAKGYIADRLKEYLKDQGIEHALINLGGNMLALGGRYDGTDFQIGIQKPFAKDGTILTSLAVSDRSVVSSGNYERYFEKDGVIYHHILDPDTGYPIQNDLYQVTILSDSSVEGDALSTACYALGLEKGMKLIRTMEGVEAVFVTDEFEVISSAP